MFPRPRFDCKNSICNCTNSFKTTPSVWNCAPRKRWTRISENRRMCCTCIHAERMLCWVAWARLGHLGRVLRWPRLTLLTSMECSPPTRWLPSHRSLVSSLLPVNNKYPLSVLNAHILIGAKFSDSKQTNTCVHLSQAARHTIQNKGQRTWHNQS